MASTLGFVHTLTLGEFAHDGLPMDPRSFNGRREKEVEKKHYPSEVHGSTNNHNSMDFVLFVDEADYCWGTKSCSPIH